MKKWFCLLFQFWIHFFLTFQAHSTPIERINIVFDMHNVTMTGYEPTPGFGDLLSALLVDPRIHLYFFSTQPIEAVITQLQLVKMPDGRTANQVATVYGGSSLGNMDLLLPKASELNEIRAQQYEGHSHRDLDVGGVYKDLRVLALDKDMPNTILVDDSFYKAHPNQISNLLWLRKDLAFHKMVVESQPRLEIQGTESPSQKSGLFGQWMGWAGRWFQRSSEDSILHKHTTSHQSVRILNERSHFILGTLRASIQMADRDGVSVSEALSKLQWGHRPVPISEYEAPLLTSKPEFESKLVSFGRQINLQTKGQSQRCTAIFN